MLVFAYKSTANNPKYHTGLGHSAALKQTVLARAGIACEVWPVVDGYELQAKLQARHVATVVLEAPWMDEIFLGRLLAQFPRTRFVLLCHSNCGFLQADAWSLKMMVDEGVQLQEQYNNFVIAGNSVRFCRAVRVAHRVHCLHLPNLYDLPALPPPRTQWAGETLRVGVFGATRVQKNLLNAVWAAGAMGSILNVRVIVSINSNRVEHGDGVRKAILALVKSFAHLDLNEIGWQTSLDFRATVARQHILLSPSYTESHHMVTCDGIAEGVPSVVGPAVHWAPQSFIAEPDDVLDIAWVGCMLLFLPQACSDAFERLEAWNARGIEAWKQLVATNEGNVAAVHHFAIPLAA
jgi:hypothetical protein